jgi:16S rRNA (guanine966-N2)-methyltransferase
MRVVAGSARGRRLEAPAGRDTRPTADRVREAVFNALGSLDAVDGASVVDLFAGSGALGIEALSRGAAHCVFVESSRAAVAVIRAKLTATALVDRATVVQADARTWCAASTARFDLVLADPPYAFDEWPALLAVVPAPLVVAESNREVVAPAGWGSLRSRRYGTTVTTFLASDPAGHDGPDGIAEGNA